MASQEGYVQYQKEMKRQAFRQSIVPTMKGVQRGVNIVAKKVVSARPVGIRTVSGGKARTQTRPSTKAQSAIGRIFGATGSRGTSKGSGRVGRPARVYKNPANVPAQQWYKIQRQMRRQAQMKAEQFSMQRQMDLARRGITQQQIQQQIQQPQTQQFQQQVQQMPIQQIQQPYPQQMPIQNIEQNQPLQQPPSIWARRGVMGQERDILGNIKQKVYGLPESFFN